MVRSRAGVRRCQRYFGVVAVGRENILVDVVDYQHAGRSVLVIEPIVRWFAEERQQRYEYLLDGFGGSQ